MERRERKTFDGGAKKAHPLIDASSFPQKDKSQKETNDVHTSQEKLGDRE